MERPNKIPDGYEELNPGAIIESDDLAYNYNNGNFIREGDLGGSDATGEFYNPGGHFYTYRKISNKSMTKSKNKYRYFISKNDDWNEYDLVASISEGGYLISKEGKSCYNRISRDYALKYCESNCRAGDWKEIKVNQAIKIIKKNCRTALFKLLDIEPIEDNPLIKEDIIKVIELLKNNRAFNADSALKVVNDEYLNNICFEMADNQIIGEYGGRFYIIKGKEIKELSGGGEESKMGDNKDENIILIKPKRKRRTKKEMEEVRIKEKLNKNLEIIEDVEKIW